MPIKPTWPYTDVVLRAHTGVNQWQKTIRGKMHYFGVLSDPAGARRRYLHFLNQEVIRTADEVLPHRDAVTLDQMVNGFLVKRHELVESGEKSAGQFVRYRKAGELILTTFGREMTVASLTPAAFARLRSSLKGGPVTVGNAIRDIRSIFNWGAKHYDVRPRYGDEFQKPSKHAVDRASRARQLWTPPEIRQLLEAAGAGMRCFILLGINCGFGQGDCAKFSRSVFNLEHHRMPRGKNLARRLCPLWPMTVAALCAYNRPKGLPGTGGLFFVTRLGHPWVVENAKVDEAGVTLSTAYKDNVSQNLRKLCKRIGVAYRPFYTFRHTFRSVADEVGDDTAINAIMGHSAGGMKAVYTQLMTNRMDRLRKVTDHVHHWLNS
jgi:integrase